MSHSKCSILPVQTLAQLERYGSSVPECLHLGRSQVEGKLLRRARHAQLHPVQLLVRRRSNDGCSPEACWFWLVAVARLMFWRYGARAGFFAVLGPANRRAPRILSFGGFLRLPPCIFFDNIANCTGILYFGVFSSLPFSDRTAKYRGVLWYFGGFARPPFSSAELAAATKILYFWCCCGAPAVALTYGSGSLRRRISLVRRAHAE